MPWYTCCWFNLYYSFIIVAFSVVCFFFFKQKTAYELRISDWSSDVCSSDLGSAHPARQPEPDPRGRHQGESPAFGSLRGGLLGSGSRHHRFHLEIGRASCRERVCQYV